MNQDDENIRSLVLEVGNRRIHSHMIGIKRKDSLAGTCGFDESVPGEGRENWHAFLKALKEINYEGYLAYEQCSPIILKGHKYATLEEVDRRAQQGFNFMKDLAIELGVYTGKADKVPAGV